MKRIIALVLLGIALAGCNTMAGMGREAQDSAREKFKDWIGGMDFVGRDEFEAVKAMAIAAREENDALKARIEALESAGHTATSKPKTATNPRKGTNP